MLFLCDLASTTLSPRMRGCFCIGCRLSKSREAFPAYAGMFPAHQAYREYVPSFPRVCGDVSNVVPKDLRLRKLSPRMRGCFLAKRLHPVTNTAFPAYAGMFPLDMSLSE